MRRIAWGTVVLALAAGNALAADAGPPPLRGAERWKPAPVLLAQETAPAPAPPAVVPPAAPPAPAPAPPPPSVTPAGGGFFVKFNNADIYEVIHTLGRTAGINYLIDPRVRGVVNVHTQGVVRKDGALDLLFAILRVNGATAVKEGDMYHIVPMTEAKMEPLYPSFPGDNGAQGPANKVVMRAFPLQYIGVGEMAKVIKPFLSQGGEAVEVARANILLVIDTVANVEKTARLVELFDSEVFRAAGMKLFQLKYLDPEEMGKNLNNIYGALDFSSTGGGKPSGINFVPIPRLNSLLVVSASPKTMEDVDKWIRMLDQEGGKTARGLHIYRVKNGKVKDLAAIVEKLYPKKTSSLAGDKATQFRPSVGEYARTAMSGLDRLQPPASYPSSSTTASSATAPSAAPAAAASARASAQAADRGQGGEEVPFDIIPSEELNSFIIRGSSSEYGEVLEILKTIDIYPQQVLLEVLVGEVNLDDTLALGVEWTYFHQSGQYKQSVSLSPVNAVAGNFRYLIEKTNVLSAAFNSLARAGKASVLSSPNVIAANGKKSRINVVTQVPVVSSSILSNSNPPVTTTTVTYMDSGIMLDFTPYINDGGLVTLEVNLEVSEVGNVAPGENPTFLRRTISTPIIASENQSIVLGGLVREQKSTAGSGIPFLYKIPLIGWLFGQRGDQVTRNELLFFITPRVIRNVEEGLALSRAFEERVNELKNRLREAEGIRLREQDYRLPGRTPEQRIPIAPGSGQ